MSAILRAWGADFDPDQFLAESGLEPDNFYRKGEPTRPVSQPDGRRYDHSGINLIASDADFCDFSGQIEEATVFLETHKSELARLRHHPGVEGMTLDFGIAWRDVIAQFDHLPPALIRVAGELGIGIEISHYPCGDDADTTCGIPMTALLAPELEQIIQTKVESELYPSASEVIHEALRLLEERDLSRQAGREDLRKAVAIGIEQIERGEYTIYEEGPLNTLNDRVTTEGRKQLSRKGEASQG